jgi:histidinol-phosphate phosphatase family protein
MSESPTNQSPPSGSPAGESPASTFSVVVPSIGRPSLQVLLGSLAAQEHPPTDVVVVDDRAAAGDVPPHALDVSAHPGARTVSGGGRGPAHARNVGWRQCRTPWVVFVDDDVVLPTDWSAALRADLARAPEHVGGSKAQVRVPMPTERRPTDAERSTAGLVDAAWATAEMAYRRAALLAVGGFDERFPRAYREDADLALRVRRAGYGLVVGSRHVVHPQRPPDAGLSLRQQRGNADDALMRRLHGTDWRTEAGCPPGRLPWHAVTVLAALSALLASAARRRRTAVAATTAWLALTTEFTVRRVLPGPRTRAEVAEMVRTSVVIPPAAVWHRLLGTCHHRGAAPWQDVLAARDGDSVLTVRAVLFDRDGTLVHDVPYNGDPTLVRPVDGASEAVDRLRRAGVAVGVLTNQSGVARGLLGAGDVQAVNRRVEELLGPFDTWQVCPHGPEDGCPCRKPAPGMVHAAAAALGVPVTAVAVVGDIGSDVRAAEAAGATGVLVPTGQTRPEEVRAAALTATSLGEAVDLLLGGRT